MSREAAADAREQRVLVLAPSEKDAALSRRILAEAGLPCTLCADLPALADELQRGAGAALLAESALASSDLPTLLAVLEAQPAWSEFPFVLLTAAGPDSILDAHVLGNVILLDQPVRVATLVSSLRVALRSRARQYEIREQLRVREASEVALREADRAKDQFLAMLAHELRNPLNAITSGMYLMRLRQADPSAMERVRDRVDRQVHHMTRLVDDLLDISRIGRGKIELRRERLDLTALMRELCEDQRGALEEAGLAFHCDFPDAPVMVEGDPTRLSQVLNNLLSNAAKFTDPGGEVAVRLIVESGKGPTGINTETRRHGEVHSEGEEAQREGEPSPAATSSVSPDFPSVSPPGAGPRRSAPHPLRVDLGSGWAVITVRDTGIGLSAEMRGRVFEPFVQAGAGPERSQGGLGLGLALVNGLVAMHGGEVRAESDGVDAGTTIIVRLPLAAAVTADIAR